MQDTPAPLQRQETFLLEERKRLLAGKLKLDLTRGRPCREQLELSAAMDGLLGGDYTAESGADTRNYGGDMEGLPEARRLFAKILGLRPGETFVGGNSSLQLMYFSVLFAWLHGIGGERPWREQGKVRFLCPVPGYDRHFRICQELGIDMEPVPLGENGPDMDAVESAVNNPAVKGIFCVPRFSNPSGIVYDENTVERIAQLGKHAAPDFRIFWDNAYAFHALTDSAAKLPCLMERCRKHGTENSLLLFYSTSKITFAGAGVAVMGASPAELKDFSRHLQVTTIGSDKINQLRHVRFLKDPANFQRHMQGHAEILRPKFQLVQKVLKEHLDKDGADGSWTEPEGGYFVLFKTRPGLAAEVVRLAAEAGLLLTPPGATHPLGIEPEDSCIRLAPTAPDLPELKEALDIFANSVLLAGIRQRIG